MSEVHGRARISPGSEQPTFPAGFRWGCATSAFQIEGALTEDGRGKSIWDEFTHTPGRIIDGTNADVATDSYHRAGDDIAALAELGVTDYRFSVAWPRVQPAGSGAVNPAGLDYYERLVDGLLAAGIDPVLTLFHWDLPAPLEADGGWLNRDTAYRFADYAEIVAERLGDRVPRWITLNEPAMMTLLGYALGSQAPGRALLFDALPTAHHQLLAHGLAVPVLRRHTDGEIGITNNHTLVVPASESDADRSAAAGYDVVYNRIFADPILLGEYPDLTPLGLDSMPGVRDGDLDITAAPLDFYGVNFYNPSRIGVPPEGSEAADLGLPFDDLGFPDAPKTGFGWPIVPAAFTELLVSLAATYEGRLPPILVTENGSSFPDVVDGGSVRDADRIDYLDAHIRAVRAAMDAGVDVRGYFVWTLVDNFEWAEGFTQPFGLVHLDVDSGVRTPKDSFRWYRDFIAQSRDE